MLRNIHRPPAFPSKTEGRWYGVPPETAAGFSIDTRQLRNGELFVALRTARRDGHAFLHAARSQGAVGAIVSAIDRTVDLPQFLCAEPRIALAELAKAHRETFCGPVIAVTGSCGKTSTKELLSRVLGDSVTHRNPGNHNNELGVPLTLLGSDPDRHQFAVIEAGINQVGEMHRLGSMIKPDVALITTVGPAHLEGLRDIETVACEKAQLLAHVQQDGCAVFPASCLNYTTFREWSGNALVVGESEPLVQGRHSWVRARIDNAGNGSGPIWVVSFDRWPRLHFRLPQASPGMRSNMALTIVAALVLGIDSELIAERLRLWTPPKFRGEQVTCDNKIFHVDCYNANPASMLDAAQAFKESYPDQPRLFVLGSMAELGATSEEWHHSVGSRINPGPDDRAILVGPHGHDLARGLSEAGMPSERLHVVASVDDAHEYVERFNGVVLLKGSRVYALERLLPDTAVADGRMVPC